MSRRLSKFRKDQLDVEKAKEYQAVIFQSYHILSIESLCISHKEGRSLITSAHLNEHVLIILKWKFTVSLN